MTAPSLNGERIVVTGASGHIGRHLLKKLEEAGASVHTTRGRVLDIEGLRGAFLGSSTVIDLAGVSGGDGDSESYRSTNVEGTAAVRAACAAAGVSRLVFSSSGHVYGVPRYLPVDEEHPVSPLSAYATSKAAAERVLLDAREGPAVAVVRMSNVYGSEFESTVIGRAIAACGSGRAIALRNLSSVRDFLFVDDAAEGLLRVAGALRPHARLIVNLSTGVGTSIGAMARSLAGLAPASGLPVPDVIEEDPASVDPVRELVLDNRKLQRLTDWVPSVPLEDGLRLALCRYLSTNTYP